MLIAALSAIVPLVMLFYRRPFLLLSLWPIFIFINVFYPSYPLARMGGLIFLPMDIVYVFTIIHLGLCALLKPTKVAAILKQNRFLSIFLGVVAVYVVVCTPIYGQSALGEARKDYFIFLFPLMALLTIKRATDLRRFILLVTLVAASLAVVAVLHGAVNKSLVRALNAQGTLIVALVMFSMVIHRIYKMVVFSPTVDMILIFIFSVIVGLSGQRSVWLAVGSGVILVLWLYYKRANVVTTMVMFTGIAVFGLFVGLSAFPELGSRLANKFAGIIDPSEDTTASWRMEAWEQQLSRLQGAKLVFGEGLGGYYSWRFSGQTLKVAPHNAYVQLVLKFGLFGLSIYGLLALQFFRKTLAVRKKLRPGPMKAYVEMGILSLGAAHIYMVGYGFDPIILIFFAVGLSAAELSQIPLRTAQYSRSEDLRTLTPYPRHAYTSERSDPRPIAS
jgi:O-Antigen ligase